MWFCCLMLLYIFFYLYRLGQYNRTATNLAVRGNQATDTGFSL
jgi:hypothetical protein